MKPPRVWVYNYNFEFELAGEQKTVRSGASFLPWHFLNRSWHALLPLASPEDEILVYEHPRPELLANLGSDSLPRFQAIQPVQESNSIFDDLAWGNTEPIWADRFRLAPWGWSPKAFAFAESHGSRAPGSVSPETVRYWNAKSNTHRMRQKNLPAAYRIPGSVVKADDIGDDGIMPLISRFVDQYGNTWIKHPFGTAGRLSDRFPGKEVSGRKIRKWESWLKKNNEILLEKQVEIQQEWSLQVEFDGEGRLLPVGLTRLYSGPAGNYSGTLLVEADQETLMNRLETLSPVLEVMAADGYTGPAGFDMIETPDGSFRLLEINCRLTMGRVAFEWHRRMAGFEVSYFTNLFSLVPAGTDDRVIIERLCREKYMGGNRIFILNLVKAPSGPDVMVSLLVQGNDSGSIRPCLDEIRARLTEF